MSIGINEHVKIWTQEISLCALRKMPAIGPVSEVTHAVRQRYNALQTEDRLSAVETELVGFQAQVHELVKQTISDVMNSLRQPQLDGPTLIRLVKEFKSINEAGYNSALFEGLFLGTSHYDSLRQSPQRYGSVLDPSATMEPGHFPIMIKLDGDDRVLAVPPAALSQILSQATGQSECQIITSDDVFAIPNRSIDTVHHSLPVKGNFGEIAVPDFIDKQDLHKPVHARRSNKEKIDYDKVISDYTEALKHDPDNPMIYIKRGLAHAGKNNYFGMRSDIRKALSIDSIVGLQLDPTDAISYRFRAALHEENGDEVKAEADYIEAMRFDSNGVLDYMHRGLLYWPISARRMREFDDI